MKNQTLLAASVAAITLLASSTAFAESYAGNVAVNSNYVWRGQTQSGDLSAVSGGIDWGHRSGAYIGGWTSSLGGNDYELDLYGGYALTTGTGTSTVELDIGFINYRYPVTGDAPSNFSEAYVNATMKNFTAGVAITLSKDGTEKDNDMYIYGTGDFEMKKDLTLSVTVGNYSFDDGASQDYTHVQVALGKDNYTFALDKNDDESGAGKDAMRLTVGFSKELDF